jgi:hypothetical protein
MTTAWSREELERIGRAEELENAAKRPDRTMLRWVPIWVVGVGDQVYVRTWQRLGKVTHRLTTRLAVNERQRVVVRGEASERLCRPASGVKGADCYLTAHLTFRRADEAARLLLRALFAPETESTTAPAWVGRGRDLDP